MWYCAEQVYPGRRFHSYALLRDDIVIADKSVAMLYQQAVADLGVSISMHKSLISTSGCLEFAKRFRIRTGTVDLSPVSLSALRNYYHPHGLLGMNGLYTIQRGV